MSTKNLLQQSNAPALEDRKMLAVTYYVQDEDISNAGLTNAQENYMNEVLDEASATLWRNFRGNTDFEIIWGHSNTGVSGDVNNSGTGGSAEIDYSIFKTTGNQYADLYETLSASLQAMGVEETLGTVSMSNPNNTTQNPNNWRITNAEYNDVISSTNMWSAPTKEMFSSTHVSMSPENW